MPPFSPTRQTVDYITGGIAVILSRRRQYLVFPIERLRELESEQVIGRLAEDQYGFGLEGNAKRLMPAIKEVALRIRDSHADLVLLVPA